MWHRWHRRQEDPDGQITAEVEFPEESQWFRGHFPGDPLLPAVAQLMVVREALNNLGARQFAITGLKRIKFKAMVRPGNRLRITIIPRGAAGTQYGFRLEMDQELVGSGMVQGRFTERDHSAAARR